MRTIVVALRTLDHRRAGGLAVAVLLALAAPVCAQTTGSVAGVVVDRTTGQPLAGAQISVLETGLGTLTNAAGRFLVLAVPAGEREVEVTFIGYRRASQTVQTQAGQTQELRFELGVSAVTLEQVVVTGTAGAVERRRVGTSMAVVNVEDVQDKVPVQSVGQILQARIPGVRSLGVVGGVGASRDLRIRGTASFQLDARPIVYIDGVRIDAGAGEWAGFGTCCAYSGGAGEDRLSDLNPEDIERIEVLKGPAAATLYGSEASNGVIQVFTKSGRSEQAPQFTLSTNIGFNRQRPNFQTKLYPRFTGPDGFRAFDANEHLIENGLINAYDLTVTGGGQDVTYFLSGGFGVEEGSVKPNWQKRGNMRMNLSWLASEAWTFALNSSYARNNVLALQSGNNWTSMLGNAVLGNPRQATPERPYGEPWVAVEDIKEIEAFSSASRWTGGLTVNFLPSASFTHRLTLGLDQVTDQKSRYMPFGRYYTYLGEIGEKSIGYRRAQNATADYLGQLNFDLTGSIASQLSFGAQGYWHTESESSAVGEGYAAVGVTTVGGAANTVGDESFEETINIGVFAQDRIAIADKLFITGALRVDGHSAFGENYGFQTYPKAALAYMISEEGFLPEFLSSLKLRSAIGLSGKSPNAYDQFRTYDPTPVLEDEPGVSPDDPGNDQLEPEKTTEIEVGFDAGLFNDRIGINVTAYRAHTRDAILGISLPPSLGFPGDQLRNVGEITNTGWEVGIDALVHEGSTLRWTTALNLDGNRNEVVDLGETAVDGRLGAFREGFPVNGVWARVVIDYDPATVTHTLSDTTVFVGRALPSFNASLANTLTFGAFTVYGLVSAERGSWFSNGDRPYRIRQGGGDEYLSTFDESLQPTVQSDSLLNYFTLSGAYDKRDNVRIQEVSLSYTLPGGVASTIGLGQTSVSLSGQNLHWWDDCNCMDPNMTYAPGDTDNFSGFLAMPQSRRFVLSIRTRF